MKKLAEFCRNPTGYDDVLRFCEEYVPRKADVTDDSGSREEEIGFVYLMKSGWFYKIRKTNAVGRREYEPAIQLSEKTNTIYTAFAR